MLASRAERATKAASESVHLKRHKKYADGSLMATAHLHHIFAIAISFLNDTHRQQKIESRYIHITWLSQPTYTAFAFLLRQKVYISLWAWSIRGNTHLRLICQRRPPQHMPQTPFEMTTKMMMR